MRGFLRAGVAAVIAGSVSTATASLDATFGEAGLASIPFGSESVVGSAADAAAPHEVEAFVVDSNYQHALAWHRALRRHCRTVELRRIHGRIGMGGDQIVSSLVGEEAEEAEGAAAVLDSVAELRADLGPLGRLGE